MKVNPERRLQSLESVLGQFWQCCPALNALSLVELDARVQTHLSGHDIPIPELQELVDRAADYASEPLAVAHDGGTPIMSISIFLCCVE